MYHQYGSASCLHEESDAVILTELFFFESQTKNTSFANDQASPIPKLPKSVLYGFPRRVSHKSYQNTLFLFPFDFTQPIH